ncbi:hypothetical protein L596_028491 [Steinernema carpocapsae]|uniref:Uncharacterized protein n=1 Tax=Steinernema carpocapsae TaxID=34508 RepID=A0A4U5LZI9_STECR|nr:hypothetical protein L596_028491 [Steinernema carpocapsae]
MGNDPSKPRYMKSELGNSNPSTPRQQPRSTLNVASTSGWNTIPRPPSTLIKTETPPTTIPGPEEDERDILALSTALAESPSQTTTLGSREGTPVLIKTEAAEDALESTGIQLAASQNVDNSSDSEISLASQEESAVVVDWSLPIEPKPEPVDEHYHNNNFYRESTQVAEFLRGENPESAEVHEDSAIAQEEQPVEAEEDQVNMTEGFGFALPDTEDAPTQPLSQDFSSYGTFTAETIDISTEENISPTLPMFRELSKAARWTYRPWISTFPTSETKTSALEKLVKAIVVVDAPFLSPHVVVAPVPRSTSPELSSLKEVSPKIPRQSESALLAAFTKVTDGRGLFTSVDRGPC